MEPLIISQLENLRITFIYIGPLLVFMMKHLKLSGCDLPPSNILCAPCDMTRAGGFNPDPGAVILCGGHFFSKQHMESTIAHELLHLYDHCRFKVDWSNLRHHACSEVCSNSQSLPVKSQYGISQIRANNLSGDCRYTRELRRGFLSFSKQHQVSSTLFVIVFNIPNVLLPTGLRS